MTTSDENTSCCKKRTRLEKCLIFGICFLLIDVVGLIVGIIIINQQQKENNNEQKPGEEQERICYSTGCITTASSVLKNMNQEIEPCEDFYNFACGNFIKEMVIPDDKASISTFSAISDDLEVKLRTLIEEVEDNAAKHELLSKQLYSSCKNEEEIENSGLVAIRDLINKLGGWPVIQGNTWSKQFEWHEFAKELRKLGYSTNYIIDFSVDVDWKDTTKHLIQLDQPSLGIAREFFMNGKTDKRVQAYYKYMVSVAKLLGADNPSLELDQSLELEINLAKISLSREDRRDYNRLYNLKLISDIKQDYPVISNWQEYIKGVLDIPGVTIEDEPINVIVPSYFEELGNTLQVEPRIIQNYVIWRVIMDSISFLNKDMRAVELEFLKEMSGVKERQTRWNECVSQVTKRLPIAVGSLYVRKHFKEEARTNSQTMVRDIGNQFRNILKTIDWMDTDTRNKALEKATKMTNHIAYPDELTNNEKLSEYYADLTFTSKDYLRMNLERNKFSVDNSFNKLKKPVDKTHWTHHANAAVVNAFYNSIFNSIEFPAGILQGVFFDNDRPRYMNYGAIGFVIGHEITHGFDDQGRQFDKDGNLMEWWNENTKNSFKEKAKCIINQYENYVVDEINEHLNGVNTQGENIADNGGIKEAYLAYKASVERDGEELRLPGLNRFTPEQMFWISAANVWCTKYTLEDLLLRVKTGVHSPGKFRVIGPMSNSEYFARDFNCKANAPMNPQNKCVVW